MSCGGAPIDGSGSMLRAWPQRIEKPTIIQSAGNKPKRIEEFVGRVNTGTAGASVARMTSPPGWVEPGQTPEFDEYTLVLRGTLRVETRGGIARRPGRAGRHRPARRVGALQHAGGRRRRVRRGVRAGLLAGHRPPRPGVTPCGARSRASRWSRSCRQSGRRPTRPPRSSLAGWRQGWARSVEGRKLSYRWGYPGFAVSLLCRAVDADVGDRVGGRAGSGGLPGRAGHATSGTSA